MAKPVTVTVSHDLGREGARARIDGGLEKLLGSLAGNMLTFERDWTDDTMNFEAKALGQTVHGTVEVREREAVIEVRLPMLLAGMAEKLSGHLKKSGTLLLEKK